MPPLTVTPDGDPSRIVRAARRGRRRGVDGRARAGDGVTGRERHDAWVRLGRGQRPLRAPRPGSGDARAACDAPGPRASRLPTAAWWCRSRPTTTSASPIHPAVIAAAHDALDRWGSGTGARPGSSSGRARSTQDLEHELADVEGDRPGGALRPPASPPTSACSPPSAAPACSSSGRAQPRARSSTAAASPRPTSPCTRHATRRRSTRLSAEARGPTRDRGDRHGVLDGRRRRADLDEPSPTSCARRRRAARRSTRPTPCSGPTPTLSPDAECVLRVGTLSKTLGCAGRVRRRPRRRRRPVGRSAALRTSSPPRPSPADAAASARGAPGACARSEGRRAQAPGCGATSTGCGPVTRRPSSRS